MDELKSNLENLKHKLEETAGRLDVTHKRRQIEVLQAHTLREDFWQDEIQAKQVMQELSALQEEVSQIDELEKAITDRLELIAIAGDQPETALISDLKKEADQLEAQLDKLEIFLFLTGPYDANPAILSVHSGQGGTEAQDWAEMLLRMYIRYAESQDWQYELFNESRGEEAGIKSATLLIKGRRAYGYLKHEQGTHRLVRQSPFNADNLRQTSFALVEVLPEIHDDKEVEINDDELEWQFFRSSGKGGQNVNKVSTAVRLTHKPTGLVVESQAERTQTQNRQLALSILKSKLWEKKQQEQEKKRDQLKGEYRPATWGTQIRNYVLHPYQLVKDTRTEVETSDAQAVLDGRLDAFIEAEIKLSTH